MSIRWKLIRENLDKKQYDLPNGECTVGRSLQSTISLPSTIVSRQHCVIHVEENKVIIVDHKSSNGTYVNNKKIDCNTQVELEESAVIGIGWNKGQVDVPENDKFVFKLVKENISNNNIFQSPNNVLNKTRESGIHYDAIRISSVSNYDEKAHYDENLKNIKISSELKPVIKQETVQENDVSSNTFNSYSNSINDKSSKNHEYSKIKYNNDNNIRNINQVKENKTVLDLCNEKGNLEQQEDRDLKRPYCVNIEQEEAVVPSKRPCLREVLIELLSDSDDDVSFEPNVSNKVKLEIQHSIKSEPCVKSVAISDDIAIYDNVKQELDSEPITIDSDDSCDASLWLSRLSQSQCPELCDDEPIKNNIKNTVVNSKQQPDENEMFFSDIIILPLKTDTTKTDNVLSSCSKNTENLKTTHEPHKCLNPSEERSHKDKNTRRTKLIDTVAHTAKPSYKEPKKKSTKRKSETPSVSINKTTSKKEERKKRLHEIATKNKIESTECTVPIVCPSNESNKQKVIMKVTTVSRGAFLTEKSESKPSSKPKTKKATVTTTVKSVRNEKDSKASGVNHKNKTNSDSVVRECSNHIKPVTKPVTSNKLNQKKKVRFSNANPEVIEFQIEPGNKLTNVMYAKPNYEYNIDRGRHSPSLDRQYIMRILKWNTNWLKEKVLINNNQLPDLTGGNVIPSHIFHNFSNHSEYAKQIGHLLLIDIWDTLAAEYIAASGQENMIEFRIESISPQNKLSGSYVTICVNLSLPKKLVKDVPKQRDLMMLNMRTGVSKFFYVQEITPLPAPPNNFNNFYSIQLHTTHSEKLVHLQIGEVVYGKKLINMNSYIILFQAVQCLATSALCDVVLHPQPHHFTFTDIDPNSQRNEEVSKWTNSLNIAQLKAVSTVVKAALTDKPSIHMIQGPPGTGKSSVICSMVMQYLYGNSDRRLKNRGKILICATSNAAVDGLVGRLLNIRQTLPQGERFRMVRVGRDEVMHESARSVSLKSLTDRTMAAPRNNRTDGCRNNDVTAEMNYLITKENMWRSALATTEDAARRAYCQSRLEPIIRRQEQLKMASEKGCMQSSVTACEQQIVQKADIIATTLTSVANYRMQWLKGLVTLCIVDEAGQAIEPVTLIPLTLGVTRIALIGDPQQLPGFTRSEVAKEYGLGESLFSRLSSCGSTWPDGGPTMLLDIQYRMHPDIADYPNRAFYAGKIRNMYTPRCDLRLPPYKVLFIPGSESHHGNAQTVNDKEAWAVARLVTFLYNMLQPKKLSLAVITPYVAQKELIKYKLRIAMEVEGDPPVEVNTIDSFQGQERDVVVVSLARRHGVGFLYDAGRMNVMLTRARHSLLICIDPNALQDNKQWRTLIDDAKKRKLYTHLPDHLCRSTSPQRAQTDDLIRYLTNEDV